MTSYVTHQLVRLVEQLPFRNYANIETSIVIYPSKKFTKTEI